MAEDELRYDRMVEDALRSVVGAALAHVAEHGLPGSHHFYITFRTDHPGVTMPARLRERYPNEMTMVIQHQYWDLAVGAESFAVTLSFSDVRERLEVPFAAVVAFADPAVRFGLQFDVGGSESAETGEPAGEAQDDAARERPATAAGMGSDKVVTLDRFRRK